MVGLSIVDMWNWFIERLQSKLLVWQYKDFLWLGSLQWFHVLQASHIYYVSRWLLSRTQFKRLDQILRSFLWSKYFGEWGLPMAPWDFCSMPKGVGELGLIDVMTQVYIGY